MRASSAAGGVFPLSLCDPFTFLGGWWLVGGSSVGLFCRFVGSLKGIEPVKDT